MGLQEFLDSIPLLVYLLLAIIIMILPIEIGYRGGKYHRVNPTNPRWLRSEPLWVLPLGFWPLCSPSALPWRRNIMKNEPTHTSWKLRP